MSRRDGILVSRSLYQMGILTVVAAIVWAGAGVYTAVINPQAVEIDKSMLTPLPPAIDKQVVGELTTRLKIDSTAEITSLDSNSATDSAVVDDTIIVDQQDELTN